MWAFNFKCPNPICRNQSSLTSKGLYNRARSVIDIKDRYYLAAEYLECRTCNKTFISYDSRLIDQFPENLRTLFPIFLTWKFACDQSVVCLMRSRTLGNSPTAVCNDIHELQTEEWMRKFIVYLSDCQCHQQSLKRLNCQSITYVTPPIYKSPQMAKWFLATYIRDVWSRLSYLKASITSVYGAILKIDSTKKIALKLQGTAADSVSWCTNIGNENGVVLLSLLTTSESLANLGQMAEGLMARYDKAQKAPPRVLYTDRDCCRSNDKSKFQLLFN